MRVKITLSYDGSRFEGFQKQNHTSNTVANKLYEVLESMGIEEKIVASGRTDKGVHATNQICHIDLPTYWKDLKYLQKHINSKISNIYIKKIEKTTDDFHARFSAKRRVYRYIISTKKKNPFLENYITFVETINEEKIKSSIKLFEGIHNFEYFKKNDDKKENFTREIYKTNFYKFKPNHYCFYFEANSFLRSQIRMMVEFLLKISSDKLTPKHLKEQLNLQQIHSKTLAKSNGLYLARVLYV